MASNNLEKDQFGWKGPYSFSWFDDAADIHGGADNVTGYNCLGATTDDGREVLIFQITMQSSLRSDKANFIHKIIIDAKSGVPFRQERWQELYPTGSQLLSTASRLCDCD